MAESLLLFLCYAVSCAAFLYAHHRADSILCDFLHYPKNTGKGMARTLAFLLVGLIGIGITSLVLLLTARPIIALVLCLSFFSLMVVLNTAKIHLLREPLVLADAWLLRQVFKYPGMYFPFFPMKQIYLGLPVVLGAVALVLYWEKPLGASSRVVVAFLCVTTLLIPALGITAMRHGRFTKLANLLLRLLPPSHSASLGAVRNGTLPSTLLHPVWAGLLEATCTTPFSGPDTRPALSNWPDSFEKLILSATSPDTQPHIVIVQAESFCDIRTKFQGRQQQELANFLPNWDALCAKGQTLPTPDDAFGAYTMRTEFSVLTGLHQQDLGPWAFNPFLAAQKKNLWSLARHFAGAGYETLFIHPYYKDFFRRDRVMANLGFQHFWDRMDCAHLARFGPHVSDLALGEQVSAHLKKSSCPVFSFIVTIEAHSPWPDNRLSDEAIAQCLPDIDLSLFSRQTQIYLCHLRHMDTLFGMLGNQQDCAKAPHPRNTLVWAYSDHDPAIDFTKNTAN